MGFIAARGTPSPSAAWLTDIANTIQHRGPDDSGVIVDGQVGLAFRRLAILDLSPAGHQPMVSGDGDVALVFNGEIFNYIELRDELRALGHHFASSGDSAVLLAAYRQWGYRCVDRFVGMFAFCIHDRRTGILLLARDRFGIKPLFVHRSVRGLLFASEIKAIRASALWDGRLNDARFAQLLVRGSADLLPESDETYLTGITQLLPGHTLAIMPDGTEHLDRYWALPSTPVPEPGDVHGTFIRLFDDSMRLRMRADVPVGVMLSGGMDSSSIACAMASILGPAAARKEPLHAFCYMSDDFDETQQVRDTIAMTGAFVHEHRSSPTRVWETLPTALWYHDEPLHSASVLVGFELYELAARAGVRVVLGGQGADETLSGYPYLFEHALVTHLLSARPDRWWRDAGILAESGGTSRRALLVRTIALLRAHLRRTSPSYRAGAAARNRALALTRSIASDDFAALAPPTVWGGGAMDLHHALHDATTLTPLPCYLRAEDRNSMAHSVEARVPFLDHRLVEFAINLPVERLMSGGWSKRILREAMQGRIPESVRVRRQKFGFPTSIRRWISGDAGRRLRDRVLDGPLRSRGWVDTVRLERAFDDHLEHGSDRSAAIFAAAQLNEWLTLNANGWRRP